MKTKIQAQSGVEVLTEKEDIRLLKDGDRVKVNLPRQRGIATVISRVNGRVVPFRGDILTLYLDNEFIINNGCSSDENYRITSLDVRDGAICCYGEGVQ